MQHCMMAETKYLESNDENGYFNEEMIVRESVLIFLKDSPFSDREIEAVRANEKRVFKSAVVAMRTWTTDMSQLEMVKHFRCPVMDWEEVKEWMGL
jgi:hypothetical protein